MTPLPKPSPSDEERCIQLVESLGGSVARFSRKAIAQVPDVPDFRIYCRGVAFFAEIKRAPKHGGADRSVGDKLTQGQLDFLKREHEAGQIVFAGDAGMLQRMVTESVPSEWRDYGWACVGEIVARGLRSER